MTHDELNEIEAAEFGDAIRDLIHLSAFHTILIPWIVEARGTLPEQAVQAENLAQLNWNSGRAALVNELYTYIETVDAAEALKLSQEVANHGRRRADANHGEH